MEKKKKDLLKSVRFFSPHIQEITVAVKALEAQVGAPRVRPEEPTMTVEVVKAILTGVHCHH